ncbi:hypothetical protein ACCY16_04825 [Candidatus Pantoea formicae]|uniref:hypothetical protein n=1 Tax=Candidatus Pantoea formicae TaxID=2608355 RepID=UPI003EDAA6CF
MNAENLNEDHDGNDFPHLPDGIPPDGAYDPSSEFFRITNKEKPSRKCFLSDYEKDPDLLDMRSGLRLICSYGVSVQNTLDGARETVGKFKNATRKRFIAKALLTGEVGKVMQTFKEEYHHTLWLYENIEIHNHFDCVEVVYPK